MPELAAHLERVASERVLKLSADLADLAANRVVTPMCPSINIEVARDFVAQFKPIVAAALAACAREAQLEEARRMYTNWNVDESIRRFDVWAQAHIAALERAVGEKASLDPQGGQHES